MKKQVAEKLAPLSEPPEVGEIPIIGKLYKSENSAEAKERIYFAVETPKHTTDEFQTAIVKSEDCID